MSHFQPVLTSDQCLIYLLSTKTRGKQYIGNTTDNFRSRWNIHKSDVGKVESSNMENVKQTIFEILSFQSDHQGFLEEEKVGLTDNM